MKFPNTIRERERKKEYQTNLSQRETIIAFLIQDAAVRDEQTLKMLDDSRKREIDSKETESYMQGQKYFWIKQQITYMTVDMSYLRFLNTALILPIQIHLGRANS